MREHLVLTVIGDDRPGLVERLSSAIAGCGASWLEGRMARLAGKFAGILRVSVASGDRAALERALGALAASGLKVAWEVGAAAPERRRAVRLELVGTDHVGIVRDVAAVLARFGVNVEELSTGCSEAPHTGQALFHATADLLLPAGLPLEDLRRELESVAADLMVDVSLAEDAPAPQGS